MDHDYNLRARSRTRSEGFVEKVRGLSSDATPLDIATEMAEVHELTDALIPSTEDDHVIEESGPRSTEETGTEYDIALLRQLIEYGEVVDENSVCEKVSEAEVLKLLENTGIEIPAIKSLLLGLCKVDQGTGSAALLRDSSSRNKHGSFGIQDRSGEVEVPVSTMAPENATYRQGPRVSAALLSIALAVMSLVVLATLVHALTAITSLLSPSTVSLAILVFMSPRKSLFTALLCSGRTSGGSPPLLPQKGFHALRLL